MASLLRPTAIWLFLGLSPSTDLEVSLNAVGSLGFGAFFKGQQLYGSRGIPQQSQTVAYKELFPVAIAAFGDLSGARGMFCFTRIMTLLSVC